MQRFPDRWYDGGHHAEYGWFYLVLFLALLAALAFVAYALGNFVFDQDWSVRTEQGYGPAGPKQSHELPHT